VDGLDENKVAQALEQMRGAMLETAGRLPMHGEFIAQCCAAPHPAAPRTEFVL
jgi:tryptophan halogenase